MNRILYLACALLVLWRVGVCVPALPDNYRTFRQPDGTPFIAKLCGDEFFNWLEDKDGYRIRCDGATGRYFYMICAADGGWGFSQCEPGKVDPKTAGLQPNLPIAKSLVSERRASVCQIPPGVKARSQSFSVRASGSIKNLVILANFSNTSTVRTPTDFQGLFNTPGYNQYGAKHSVRDYYDEVSYGQLTLQSTVVGWITLPQDNAYYAGDDDNNGEGDGSFGLNFDKYPFCAQKLAEDAIAAVDPFVDFTQFDGDGDGWIDAIDIIHQGAGAEVTGNISQIWSHFAPMHTVYTTGEGVKIGSYHTEPELYDESGGISRIGVICHETGHFFGLLDLYDYDMDSYGIGIWGLMSWGAWADGGATPSHLCAWSRRRIGWSLPYLLNTTRNGVTLPASEIQPFAYKITIGMPAREYFLIENRQRIGFDSYLPDDGLLVYHVDELQENNDSQSRYLAAVEQADGLRELELRINKGNAGDPFPGSSLNRFFTESTNPNSNPYDGGALYIRLKNIALAGADVSLDSETRAPYLWSSVPVSYDGNYTLQWTQSIGATAYVFQEGERSGKFTFSDGAEYSLDNWLAEGFVRTASQAHSGSYSFYSGVGERIEHRIELGRILQPRNDTQLTFWRYYEVNDDGDCVYLEVAREGRDWEILKHYAGSQKSWTLDTVSLSSYAGDLIRVRFRYVINKGAYGEGFYFDDVWIENAVEIQWTTLASSMTSRVYSFLNKQGGVYSYRVAGKDGATQYPWSNIVNVDDQVPAVRTKWSFYQ